MTRTTAMPLSTNHLTTTTLAELNSAAGLLTRVDRKYLVPLTCAQNLVDGLAPHARVLAIDERRRFSYTSTYFDTPGLEAFMLAARKRRRRFKVRTRTYLDSGLCFLEVKTCGARGSTVKRRMGYYADDASRLTGPGRAFVAACLAGAGVTGSAAAREVAAALRPVLTTTYERTTLHLPRAEARATIDTALTWRRLGPAAPAGSSAGTIVGVPMSPQALRPAHLAAAINEGEPVSVADIAVVETKNPATPSPADRALWEAGYRPTRISKYATGMALLHPELPANRWYRTLTHELAGLFGTDRSSLECLNAA
ncbi:polyphosphate polymerase domain-containing protein [Actinomyces naeslundii]|uniref:VTC domain protein n=2 Tax=Actinomyces naeslundii TaxID=1655 RepID=J3F2G4_ACTNH|nr:polyphosphate polymerase domain-containing protein [Actinomyces naeslundii]EJN84492.1 VTC domain protein [Actinomyces naeslundii str. Howell 279]OMG34095.1 molecular chaperone [Actinomyces naeslundii]OMG34375.1 molecular chaperone [Actinomyces naeslundii]QQC19679.1 polyphosphate polymerase domain-containing protein [Actinomyces naeslundii]